MRTRITRALFTAAAAGATIITLGFAAASPAGAVAAGHHFRYFNPSAPQVGTNANCASTAVKGTWTTSDCGKVGYVATGRDFRFASAVITVPNHIGAVASDPTIYVALDASSANNDFARAGVMPCTTGAGGTCPAGDTSGWEAFTQVQEPGSSAVNNTAAISSSLMGDGVSVQAYLVPTGNSVHFVVSSASVGTLINTTDNVSGPVYTDAQALADWTTATTKPAPAPPAPSKVRDTQFFQGRFTTQSGAQGTFKGPWTLTAVDATSNGQLAPSGTLIGQASYLWNDGNSFGGMGNDAFGVWRFPF
jgi:hypothetical protein